MGAPRPLPGVRPASWTRARRTDGASITTGETGCDDGRKAAGVWAGFTGGFQSLLGRADVTSPPSSLTMGDPLSAKVWAGGGGRGPWGGGGRGDSSSVSRADLTPEGAGVPTDVTGGSTAITSSAVRAAGMLDRLLLLERTEGNDSSSSLRNSTSADVPELMDSTDPMEATELVNVFETLERRETPEPLATAVRKRSPSLAERRGADDDSRSTPSALPGCKLVDRIGGVGGTYRGANEPKKSDDTVDS